MECSLYPCFDITSGKIKRGKNGRAEWVCGVCVRPGANISNTSRIVEKFLEKTGIDKIKFEDPDMKEAQKIIEKMKTLEGLGKYFFALSASEKQSAFNIERKSLPSNIGVLSCLLRDITVAFSHGSAFRPPPLPEVLLARKGKIIGEQSDSGKIFYEEASHDEALLPSNPFPEIKGKNICSGSPSPSLDRWLREKMKVSGGDATLLLGVDL